jgi:hypothetical protein
LGNIQWHDFINGFSNNRLIANFYFLSEHSRRAAKIIFMQGAKKKKNKFEAGSECPELLSGESKLPIRSRESLKFPYRCEEKNARDMRYGFYATMIC